MRINKKHIKVLNGKKCYFYNEYKAQRLMKQMKLSFAELINKSQYKGINIIYDPTNTI